MTQPFTYSWHSIERGCWEYWNRVFGTLENVTAFSMRDLPKTLPNASSFIWRFSINGGEIAVPRSSRSVAVNGAWHMDAMLEAWCPTDELALWIGGTIMDNEPVVSTDVDGLLRLYVTAFPSREPDMIRLGGDDNAGQEILCVRLTVPMKAAFSNVEQRV